MSRARSLLLAAAAAALGVPSAAQQPDAGGSPRYDFHGIKVSGVQTADYYEQRAFGGFVFTAPNLGLEIRGLNALILADVDARTMLDQPSTSGLPRRGIEPPAPRRRLSADQLRSRVEQTMRTFGQDPPVKGSANADKALELVRFLYFEGGVIVLQAGVEMLRCERLWIAPAEDRIVAEEVELRYLTNTATGPSTVVIRGPKLTKSGVRWTGRDLTITTCTAAEPHVALAVGEAEIIERTDELEIRARGQSLQFSGVAVLPLPDAHFFTGSQTQFPIKSARAGYAGKEGYEAEVVLGLPWNTTGGRLHNFLTGRPAAEFRGEWELGIGWQETRGVPLSPVLSYGVPELYQGRTEAFWLDDRGRDLREIQANFDGSAITGESRGLVRTQNRLFLGEQTHFDLQAFTATDPAVLSEFFAGDYRAAELPETSGYLHHQHDNHLITFGARTNLDSFSYRDNRSLAPRFVEELPVLTWNWLAQPIAETPWETPIVLDTATELGQRRSDFDDRAMMRASDRTFRADQTVELSAPFAWGPVSVRPFLAGRGTFYNETIAGSDEGRVSFEGGVQLGTRLSRVFDWVGDEGSRAVRHVIAPRITFANRFHVDDRPAEFHQFDGVDMLTERQLVRIEVRNLLHHQDANPDANRGPTGASNFMMLDLAQDLWPDASRDNNGEEVGLLYYDFLVRPPIEWIPFDTFTYAIYGDHDWKNGLRTLDTELSFGPFAGLTWTLEYRTDQFVDGAVGISANTRLFDRWTLFASSLRDLQLDDWLSYGFGIQRNDHDWSVALTGGYDPFTDETTIRLDFVPTLPGLARRRTQRFGATHLHDAGFATQY